MFVGLILDIVRIVLFELIDVVSIISIIDIRLSVYVNVLWYLVIEKIGVSDRGLVFVICWWWDCVIDFVYYLDE